MTEIGVRQKCLELLEMFFHYIEEIENLQRTLHLAAVPSARGRRCGIIYGAHRPGSSRTRQVSSQLLVLGCFPVVIVLQVVLK